MEKKSRTIGRDQTTSLRRRLVTSFDVIKSPGCALVTPVLISINRLKQQTVTSAMTTLLLCFGTRLEAAETTNESAGPVATMKFRLRNGQVMLPASVNGSEPLSFLLDTGYSITTIHPSLAGSLNLKRAGQVTIVGIAGEEDAPTYGGVEFRFGDVTYSPRRVAAVPSESQRRRRRDGIIGSGFFRRFVVQLDFPSATARLFAPETFAHASSGEVIPLQFRRETPIVSARLPLADGRVIEGRFEIDTGCDDGVCLGRDFVRSNKLDEALSTDGDGAKVGVGGEASIVSGTVPALRLGALEAKQISASLFRDGSPAGEGLAGHIGMSALSQFNVTFDYRRRQMILEPRKEP